VFVLLRFKAAVALLLRTSAPAAQSAAAKQNCAGADGRLAGIVAGAAKRQGARPAMVSAEAVLPLLRHTPESVTLEGPVITNSLVAPIVALPL